MSSIHQYRTWPSLNTRAPGKVDRRRACTSLLLLTRSALDRFLAAQSESSKLVGSDHPSASLCSLNVAIALGVLGRFDEARAIIDRAAPVLEAALGPDAPSYRRLKDLRIQLDEATLRANSLRSIAGSLELGVRARATWSDEFFS